MPNAVIKTSDSITFQFIVNGVGIYKTVNEPVKFKQVCEAYAAGKSDSELLDLIDPTIAITAHSSGLFGVKNGQVFINNEALPDALSARILDFVSTKLPFEPLIKFWENCKLNPNPRAKTDLYKFLENNGHPITADGCFIAYRAIRYDFLDKYTGKIDNSVGAVVKMDRALVDPNPDVTCSHGLHAASFNYARNIYGSCGYEKGDILVEVKINPKDVCAIPTDYNNQKMRVCEYTVLAVNSEGVIERPCYDPDAIPSEDDWGDEEDGDWDDEDDEDEDNGDLYREDCASNIKAICNGNCSTCSLGSDNSNGDTIDSSHPVDDSGPSQSYDSPNANDNWKTQQRDNRGRFLPKV